MPSAVQRWIPVYRLVCRYWVWLVLGTLMALTASLAGVSLLAISGWFIAAAAQAGLLPSTAMAFNFFFPGIAVRLLAIVRTLARYAERLVTHEATLRLLAGLRTLVYARLEPLAPARLGEERSGDLLNRLVADVDTLDDLYPRLVSPAVVALTVAGAACLFLGYLENSLGLAGLIFFALGAGVLPALVAFAGAAAGREAAQQSARLRVRMVDLFQGLAELIVFGAQTRHLARIAEEDRRLVGLQGRLSRLRAAAAAALVLVSGAALCVVVYIGAGMVAQDRLGGPLLALLALVVLAAFDSLAPLLAACPQIGETRTAARRLAAILTADPAVRFREPAADVPPDPRLDFEDVSFQYPGRNALALEALTLHVPAGGRLAVLGHTGAGKSTLAGLLARFWDPGQGRILLGGIDLRDLNESSLRRSVSVVPQAVHVFESTLRANLILARPGADDDRLYAALQSACLLEWVQALPRGLDTWLGSSGRRLSGGEARRLAVARAVLQNAPVWVLDEPSEGLDRITARALVASLKRVTAGKTVLLITHRLHDLPLADKIAVLENGRVVEQGSHRRLAVGSTRYAQLLRRL